MNEIIPGLPFLKYVRMDGINSSVLPELGKSPMHAKAYIDSILKSPPEPKVHFRMGSITHRLVLEPGAPLDDMAVKPEGLDGRSSEGRQWLQAHKGKMVLTRDEWLACVGMADALLANPTARKILEEGQSEQSLFAEYPVEEGKWPGIVQRKGRTDHLPFGNVICDVKTVGRDASKNNFERAIWDFQYYLKAAFYLDLANALGLNKEVFIFLAVEKDQPHGVMVYQLDREAVEAGRREYRKLLSLWNQCKSEDKWPGYPTEIQLISLPKYAWNQLNQ